MMSSDAPVPAVTVAAAREAEELAAAASARISDDCWEILNYFRRHNWEATALDLVREVNPLGYRQRLTDLRRIHLIDAVPDPPHPSRGEVAIYKISPELRPRAEWLLEHLSLEGFPAAGVQKGMFA